VTRYEQLREELGDLDPPIALPERPGPLLEAVLFLLDRSEGERRVLLAEVAQLREQCADLPLLRQELAEIRIRAARLEQEALQEARQALVDRLAICLAERKAQERAKRLGKRLAREQAIKAQRRRLSAWRASLVGILRSRVMPPPIATLAARVEWLQGQGRQVGPKKVVEELQAQGAKIRTIAKRADSCCVPPRWLAFGECEEGADWEGLRGRLKKARIAQGLNQRALALRAGVADATITALEAGYRGGGDYGVSPAGDGAMLTASVGMAQKLARALGVRPGWLAFGGDG
jgi:DNA-binding XRE family transcriptional regulator